MLFTWSLTTVVGGGPTKEMAKGSVEYDDVDIGCEMQLVQSNAPLGDESLNQYMDDPAQTLVKFWKHFQSQSLEAMVANSPSKVHDVFQCPIGVFLSRTKRGNI